MKRVFVQISLLCIIIALCLSCGENSRKRVLPSVSGATNELLVIMNSTLWQGVLGDSIRHFFQQEQIGLPQPEPMFDIINLPSSNFERDVKSHRNVFIVKIKPQLDSATFLYKDSPWADSQKLFEIEAPDTESFLKLFDEKKKIMMATYLKAERDRLISVYKNSSDEKIFKLFKNKFNLLVSCPTGYNINKSDENFAWISSETPIDSKGIVFFQEKYEEEGQLNYTVIIDKVNEVLKANIPGPLKDSWMKLDTYSPITSSTYNYNNENYAIMMRGLWDVENDFMGGPFILNVVLDQEYGRILYMMGYVYAPEGKKRNFLRQVESIIFTMGIVNEIKPAE